MDGVGFCTPQPLYCFCWKKQWRFVTLLISLIIIDGETKQIYLSFKYTVVQEGLPFPLPIENDNRLERDFF